MEFFFHTLIEIVKLPKNVMTPFLSKIYFAINSHTTPSIAEMVLDLFES